MRDDDTTTTISRAARASVDRSTTVAGLVAGSLADAVEVLEHAEREMRSGADERAVHRARVATRRLRAALKALRPVGDRTQFDGLRSELAWLAGLLGAVRDVDVLTPLLHRGIDDLTDPPPDRSAVDQLDRRLQDQRRLAELTLLDAMASDRHRTLIQRLHRLAGQPPLGREVDGSAPPAAVARHAAHRSFRRADRYARSLGRRPGDEQLHALRKKVKRARYAAELAAPALGGSTSKLAERLSAVQDALGAHQDAVTLRRWLAALPLDDLDPGTVFTAGRLHQALASGGVDRRPAWQPVWRKARKAARARKAGLGR